MSFVNAVRAEFAKIFTVRLWWILALTLFGYVAFVSALLALIFGGLGDQLESMGEEVPPVPLGGLHLLVYSTASSVGYVIPVLFGALATTAEFRHQTLTPTFLANPHRGQVLGAKITALAVIGALFGVIALLGSMGAGAPVLAATGQDAALADSDTWSMVARLVLAMALWAVIGVALGSVVPSQVAVIVIVLAFTQFLEPILRTGASVFDWTARIGQFLPGAASDSLVGASVFSMVGQTGGASVQLDWWQGGLVLLAIAVVGSVIGFATTWRKDVT